MELNLITDENKERLILEVQKYPCLYDPRTGGYHDKTARGNAWEKNGGWNRNSWKRQEII